MHTQPESRRPASGISQTMMTEREHRVRRLCPETSKTKEIIMNTRLFTCSFETLASVFLAGFLLVTANAVGAVFADINVLDSASDTFTGYIATGGQTITFSSFGSFSPSGADKLVVTFGMRHSGTPSTPISSVTYAGQAMTEAVGTGDGVIYESAIWYLDNPGATTGSLVATMARGYGAAATIWALSGTADGHGATGSAPTGSSTSLTTISDKSWVIAHSTVVGDAAAPLAQAPLTVGESATVLYTTPPNTTRNHSSGTGYQIVPSAGLFEPAFDIGNTTVAAEFTAAIIPEPSTLILAGLGLAGLTLRRRRSA